MGKLVQEYMEILQKDVSASGRFWTLEERIKKDRKNPGLIVEMSRRRLLSNLANLAPTASFTNLIWKNSVIK